MQSCVIPVPLSVNNLYKNAGKRRIATDEYKAWQLVALYRLRRAKLRPVTSNRVLVWLKVFGNKGFNPRRDVENCAKASTDALVAAGVIPGDSIAYVQGSVQTWEPLEDKSIDAYAIVEIYENFSVHVTEDVPDAA